MSSPSRLIEITENFYIDPDNIAAISFKPTEGLRGKLVITVRNLPVQGWDVPNYLLPEFERIVAEIRGESHDDDEIPADAPDLESERL